jgi:hypothetical protein
MTPTPTSNINCAAPTRCWATQAADTLVAMQTLVADATAAGADQIDPDALDKQVRLYRSAVRIGATQTAARTSKLMRKHHALARRLLERQNDYLRFTTDWRVPPDNNGSEVRHEVARCEWTRRKEGRRLVVSAA